MSEEEPLLGISTNENESSMLKMNSLVPWKIVTKSEFDSTLKVDEIHGNINVENVEGEYEINGTDGSSLYN